MIRDVHPRFRVPTLIFYPSRIPDQGVKQAPVPGSRIRIRNTVFEKTFFFIPKKTGLDPDPDSATAWIRMRLQQNAWIRSETLALVLVNAAKLFHSILSRVCSARLTENANVATIPTSSDTVESSAFMTKILQLKKIKFC
jgi:hypothetical protein